MGQWDNPNKNVWFEGTKYRGPEPCSPPTRCHPWAAAWRMKITKDDWIQIDLKNGWNKKIFKCFEKMKHPWTFIGLPTALPTTRFLCERNRPRSRPRSDRRPLFRPAARGGLDMAPPLEDPSDRKSYECFFWKVPIEQVTFVNQPTKFRQTLPPLNAQRVENTFYQNRCQRVNKPFLLSIVLFFLLSTQVNCLFTKSSPKTNPRFAASPCFASIWTLHDSGCSVGGSGAGRGCPGAGGCGLWKCVAFSGVCFGGRKKCMVFRYDILIYTLWLNHSIFYGFCLYNLQPWYQKSPKW